MDCTCGERIIGIAYHQRNQLVCASCAGRDRFVAYGMLPRGLELIPYKRMTQKSKWTKRNQEYLASKGAVGRHVLADLAERAPVLAVRQRASALLLGGDGPAAIDFPVRVGVAVWIPTNGNGRLGNVGDFSNWLKALEDGLCAARVIADDTPDHVVGPAPVGDLASGVYRAPSGSVRRFGWSITAAVNAGVLIS